MAQKVKYRKKLSRNRKPESNSGVAQEARNESWVTI